MSAPHLYFAILTYSTDLGVQILTSPEKFTRGFDYPVEVSLCVCPLSVNTIHFESLNAEGTSIERVSVHIQSIDKTSVCPHSISKFNLAIHAFHTPSAQPS